MADVRYEVFIVTMSKILSSPSEAVLESLAAKFL